MCRNKDPQDGCDCPSSSPSSLTGEIINDRKVVDEDEEELGGIVRTRRVRKKSVDEVLDECPQETLVPAEVLNQLLKIQSSK